MIPVQRDDNDNNNNNYYNSTVVLTKNSPKDSRSFWFVCGWSNSHLEWVHSFALLLAAMDERVCVRASTTTNNNNNNNSNHTLWGDSVEDWPAVCCLVLPECVCVWFLVSQKECLLKRSLLDGVVSSFLTQLLPSI